MRNYRMFYYDTFRPNTGDFGPTMSIELVASPVARISC